MDEETLARLREIGETDAAEKVERLQAMVLLLVQELQRTSAYEACSTQVIFTEFWERAQSNG